MSKSNSESVSVSHDKKGNATVDGRQVSRDKKGNEYVGNERLHRRADGSISHIGNRAVHEHRGKK